MILSVHCRDVAIGVVAIGYDYSRKVIGFIEGETVLRNEGLVAKARLDADDIVQLHDLQNLCEIADGFSVKLNWDAIADRDPRLSNDFCFYENDRLIGYAALDDYEPARETTAVVHPDFRRRGLFRQLLNAVVAEAQRRDCGPLLLVAYRTSSVTPPNPTCAGARYKVSEYRMEATLTTAPRAYKTALSLMEVTPATAGDLSRGLAIAFGAENSRPPERLLREMKDPNIRYFLPMLDDAAIGQIGVVRSDDDAYIRAVGIYPEFRRRGYARQMLAEVMGRMYQDGCHRFSLDVETENAGALSIYTSCGFSETTIYDYYTIL